jgi:hypothetical protein
LYYKYMGKKNLCILIINPKINLIV